MKLLTQWAAASGALILVVLAVRRLCRNRLSARLRYALWAVVLMRLLAPVQLPLLPASAQAAGLLSDVAGRVDRQMVYAIPEQVYPGRPELSQPIIDRTTIGLPDGREHYSGGVVIDREATTHYSFMMPAGELAVLLWCAGAGAMALVLLGANLRFAGRLRRGRRALEVPDCPLPVYEAQGLPSPCLFGVVRPAVYLTPEAAALPGEQRRHILAHELTHYAHRDHIWSLLRCAALALHWYNPLVWLAVLVSKGDGELACDEGTVARLGEEERIPYGRTLVELVARRSLRPRDLLSCSTAMTGGRKTIQQRIALLVKRPETKKTALFAAAALVALGAVFAFGGGGRDGALSYHGFLDAAGSAQSIRYGPPIYSSLAFPDPITDQDLLEQAKQALSGFRALEQDDPQPDLSPEQLIHVSRIILTLEDGEMTYSLLRQGSYTYLFPGSILTQSMELRQEEGETARLWGVSGSCISERGDNVTATLEELAREQWERSYTWTALTDEELSWFQETFFDPMEEKNIHNQFLTCFYDRPEDIDLFQLFYNGSGLPDTQPLTQAELRALTGTDDWQGVGGNRVTRDEMDTVLQANTGLSLDQTGGLGLEQFTYLPEYGAYYVLHGDTNVEPVSITSGFRKRDILTLYYSFGYGGESRVVTLRQAEDGYQFVANQDADQLQELTGQQWKRQNQAEQSSGGLTQEQIDRVNEAFRPDMELPDGSFQTNEISCFFTSSYDDPTQIDLESFLCYCPIGTGSSLGEDDTEEFLAVMERNSFWDNPERTYRSPQELPVPVHRYPRQAVSALLQKYADVTVEELDWSNCLYLEEYDCFYNFTSDYGPGVFPCTGGQVSGDTALLWTDTLDDGSRSELTLRKAGDRWFIQSLQLSSMYEH